MSNLKPAPLPLTPDVVAKLAGDRPALGKGIIHLTIEGKLRDRSPDLLREGARRSKPLPTNEGDDR